MNDPFFTDLRRQIDAAITFDDTERALYLAAEGLSQAQTRECPGEAMYFRAQEMIIAGRFAEAIGWLEQALVFNPLDGAAYNDIALCLVETGRIDGVLDIFDQGLAVEEDYATIHHNKGWFLNKIGRSTEALASFRRAIELEPERAVTWENMADAYESLERIPEAIDAYRRALSFLKVTDTVIHAQLLVEISRLTSFPEKA